MAYLTSRTQASSVACNDLVHIVKTNVFVDGNPDGSSFKATVGQLLSGCCVNDFYVKNIHGCNTGNLFVQPLDEGNIYFGSRIAEDGFTIDLDADAAGNTRLGLHENSPNYTFDFYSWDRRSRFFWYDDINRNNEFPAFKDLQYITTSGASDIATAFVVYGPGAAGNTQQGSGGVALGFRGFDSSGGSLPGYGAPGDAFLFAAGCTRNLNIVNDLKSTCPSVDNHIDFYPHCNVDSATSGPYVRFYGRENGASKQGFVGLFTENPTQRLDVNGNGRFRFFNPSSAANLQVGSDGTLQLASSDVRLKENISTIENALDKVLSLRGVNFSWKQDVNLSINLGFIAQEVESVEPNLVFTNDNTEDKIKGVHYDMFAPLLVEAVKELNEKTKLKEYTPTSISDPYGEKGDQVFDDNFMYIKTGAGWKKFPLMDI
jgi:hypothetical protein